ncbi:MAG: GldG family protein, partial [Treponema sp.]|nr:GldG family protein [Treponema sp.]
MNRSKALYKAALFSFFIDPIFYVTSILTVLFSAFSFFFQSKFFVAGLGSSDLRPFFNSIPYISILTLPLLSLRIRPFLLDDSLPLSPFKRIFTLTLSLFTVLAIPLILLFSLPLTVNAFGSIDFGQALSGFLGLFLFAFTASALTLLLFEIFSNYTALPLFISALILAIVNFLHLLPLYLNTGRFLTFICHSLSFAWHFDSFSKGIFDSRKIFYYLLSSLILILITVLFEEKRCGKKINKLNNIKILLSLIFLSLASSNLYTRLDISRNKTFTVSSVSKELLSQLEGNLRITYFRSSELKDLYPQTSDIADYLMDYASLSKNISFTLEKADEEKLKALGIQGQQIRHSRGSKTEYVTVYSAILLQYLDKSTLIPFLLSTNTLEYDLSQRIQQLVSEKERKVYLACGNGRSIEESYYYVEPWLTSRGFTVEVLNEFNLE